VDKYLLFQDTHQHSGDSKKEKSGGAQLLVECCREETINPMEKREYGLFPENVCSWR
jgi:hypothetical protein